ncbi:MAG: heme-binding domain-containing protein [Bacteroidetes bacterium]|nr:heme-binding domain-containing protein [Bacteroidota bacterium]
MIKKILIGLLIVLIAMQFIRPEQNLSGDTTKDITTIYPMSDSVKLVFDKACADCHTNKTNYPWYTAIQPIGYWTADHVKDGKRHFNLNEFAGYRLAKQNHKLEEVIEQIKEGEMPLTSYTIIHTEAKLTEAEKATLTNWCQNIMDTLKANYPADSLILKKPTSPAGAAK